MIDIKIMGKRISKSSVNELITCSCRLKEKSSSLFILLFHMLLVGLSCFEPEWKGSEVTNSDKAGDEWTIHGWIGDASHSVGHITKDSWGNGLSNSDTEEVD